MKLLKLLLAMWMAALFTGSALAASVDGLELHSTVEGEGKTIIFVHGWTCDETSWSKQAAAFAQNYQVITLDLPGHGRSDAPAQADFSMDLFAAAVEAVRQEAGADRVVLVGHSMGGPVIRQYALNYPEHVAGLVAVDGRLDVRPVGSSPVKLPPLTPERRAFLVEDMFVDGTSEALRTEIRALMLGTPNATALGAGAAMLDPSIQSDRLITVPAMTVWAATRASGTGPRTKEMLPNWEEVQLADTGHFLMMEMPEKFNGLLETFLETRAEY